MQSSPPQAIFFEISVSELHFVEKIKYENSPPQAEILGVSSLTRPSKTLFFKGKPVF